MFRREADFTRKGAPNNGMHPTPNQQVSYPSWQQGAGDAGR